MISTAYDLMHEFVTRIGGNAPISVSQAEKIIEEYAIKCVTMAVIRSEIILIKDGIEYVHDLYDPMIPMYTLEEEISLMDAEIKNGLKSLNLFKYVKAQDFNHEAHKNRIESLCGSKFYAFCNGNEHVMRAFNSFIHRENHSAANNDWRKVIFFGGFACIIIRLMAWMDSYPASTSEKPKKKLKAISIKIHSLLKDIEASEFDFGYSDFKQGIYIDNMIESSDINERAIKVDFGNEYISKSLKNIADIFDKELAGYGYSSRSIGKKDVVRRLYLMITEALMKIPNGNDEESIRAAVLAHDDSARELVMVIDEDGVNSSAASGVEDIVKRIMSRRACNQENEATFMGLI